MLKIIFYITYFRNIKGFTVILKEITLLNFNL